MSYDATGKNQSTGRYIGPSIRKEPDGTWSALVWAGQSGRAVQNVRRYGGYRTRAEARKADISELPQGGYIIHE